MSSSSSGRYVVVNVREAKPKLPPLSLISSAERGDAEAQYNLGLYYIHEKDVHGESIERKRDDFTSQRLEGIVWLRKAAAQGLTQAQEALGFVLSGFMHPNPDRLVAPKTFYPKSYNLTYSASLDPISFYWEAVRCEWEHMYYDPRFTLNAEASKWYEQAAINGSEEAEACLAFMKYRARGNAIEKEKAKKAAHTWFRFAAEKRFAQAQFFFAVMDRVIAKPENFLPPAVGCHPPFVTILQKSAEENFPPAQYLLALYYLDRQSRPAYAVEGNSNKEMGLNWIKQASAAGSVGANFYLYHFYSSPEGHSLPDAHKYLEKAMQLGCAQAYSSSAYRFQIEENFVDAIKKWKLAAERGNLESCDRIACARSLGMGRRVPLSTRLVFSSRALMAYRSINGNSRAPKPEAYKRSIVYRYLALEKNFWRWRNKTCDYVVFYSRVAFAINEQVNEKIEHRFKRFVQERPKEFLTLAQGEGFKLSTIFHDYLMLPEQTIIQDTYLKFITACFPWAPRFPDLAYIVTDYVGDIPSPISGCDANAAWKRIYDPVSYAFNAYHSAGVFCFEATLPDMLNGYTSDMLSGYIRKTMEEKHRLAARHVYLDELPYKRGVDHIKNVLTAMQMKESGYYSQIFKEFVKQKQSFESKYQFHSDHFYKQGVQKILYVIYKVKKAIKKDLRVISESAEIKLANSKMILFPKKHPVMDVCDKLIGIIKKEMPQLN
jgi:TPR repeat protein